MRSTTTNDERNEIPESIVGQDEQGQSLNVACLSASLIASRSCNILSGAVEIIPISV